MSVYQNVRYGNTVPITWTFPGLTANANYLVRLHFSEDWRTTNGSGSDGRVFGVTINGAYVLGHDGSHNDFDVFAVAATQFGVSDGRFKAFTKEFLATADANGKITIVCVKGAKSNPFTMASEILPAVPAAPTGLTATPATTQIGLSWNAMSGVTYNVKRSMTSGGPYSIIATGVSAGSYIDTSATYGTPYYYVVSALGATGESLNSIETAATIVNSGADFNVLVSGNPQTALAGGSVAYTVKVVAVNGSPTVNLSLTGLPADGVYSFTPSSVSGTGYSTLSIFEPTIGIYPLTLLGTSGSAVRSVPVTLSVSGVPDFTVSAASQSVLQGNTAKITVSIGSLYGFSGTIGLSASGLPSGTTGTFSPASVSGQGSATLTIPTTYTTAAGSYTVTVTGTCGATVHTATITLTVSGPQDFTVSSTQDSQTVMQGGDASFTVDVGKLNGFSNNVLLNVNNLPTGARAVFSSNTVSGSGSSTITIATDNSTAIGTFPLTIVGASADLVRTVPVTLTVQPSGATPPPAPTDLSAAGAGANAIALSWTSSPGATGYNINRSGTQGGPYTTIASNAASTVYTDGSVTDGTSYYYVITALGAGGESGYSNAANARPHLSPVYQVNAGGNAAGTWSADSYVVAGSTQAVGNLVDMSHVVAPAPLAVYQSMRWFGASPYFSYVFPNLTPGATYTVRLHFAENWHGGPGDPRKVSASINGASVLSNFDIAATAGGQYIAIVEEFTATADSGGNITVAISGGGAGNPMINGIEVLSATPVLPAAPANLTAVGGATSNMLSWRSAIGAASYNIKRSTTPGGPYTSIGASVTNTVYTDSTAANLTTYYYAVTAVNSAGEGPISSEANATAAAGAGFAVSAIANTTSVVPGHNQTYTVTVTQVDGFTGVVNLSASSLPPGATATFNPAAVTISNATPATTTMTLATTTSVNSGNNTFAILGTSGATHASTTVAFSVAWVLSWSDEFNATAGTQPDSTYWSYDLGGGGWGNSELECYTNSTNNIAEDGNGNLVITGTYAPAGFACPGSSSTYYYSSARIKTNYMVPPYGRYEARIKVPYGKGVFPAFWMLGNGTNCTAPLGSWPSCGEIDVMENFSQEPSIVHSTIHRTYADGVTTGSNPNSCSAAVSNGATFADDFHTFAIEWAQESITFYVDDNRCGTILTPVSNTAAAWPYDNHPFQILLNFAVGGVAVTAPDATTVWPQNMYIDYIRVFSAAH
jgi:beta-glucanase (GH16 family)